MMPNSAPATSRPWTSIVDEVTTEKNPTRLLKLVKELNKAMDEQGVGRPRTRTKHSRCKESGGVSHIAVVGSLAA